MKPTNTDVLQSILFDRMPKPRKFEDRLWSAADNLRASARLKSSEYAAPLLGLFFLRYASNRFNAIKPQAEQEFEAGKDSRNSETVEEIYKRLCGFYLPEAARYETLLNLTDADNVQQAVIEAMTAFETENESLEVSLPKNEYLKIPHKTLRDILNILSEIAVVEGDVFGKIYEYFLGKFALSEGQKGGEFYTPTSVVKLIVEVIEPFKADARVFDLLFEEHLSEADTKKVKEAAQALLQKLKDNETRRTVLTTDWHKHPQLQLNVEKMIGDVLNTRLPASYDKPTFQQKRKAVYTHVYNVASRGKAYWV